MNVIVALIAVAAVTCSHHLILNKMSLDIEEMNYKNISALSSVVTKINMEQHTLFELFTRLDNSILKNENDLVNNVVDIAYIKTQIQDLHLRITVK